MTAKRSKTAMPPRPPGRPRSSQPKGDAARFLAALSELGLTPDSFAQRSGIRRETVYRWIRENTVPAWAAWIIELLQERQETAERLSRPAE